jgi:Holliday junction resolvase
MKNENVYQARVIRRLKREFPNAIVIKNDPNYIQGIPDLIVLNGSRWVAIEVKRSENEPFQPNQMYYLELMDSMSAAFVIFPENEERVFNDLQLALSDRRQTRLSKS